MDPQQAIGLIRGLFPDQADLEAGAKTNLLSTILGLFGRGEPKPELAPMMGAYPNADDTARAKQFGAAYGSGHETLLETGRLRDATNLTGDLSSIARVAQASWPKESPAGAELLQSAHLASLRSAIMGLGFDPRRLTVDFGGPKNLGGFFVPGQDMMWATARHPSAIAHESLHRGLDKLRKADVLSPEERFFLDKDEESIVRYIMAKQMGNPEPGAGEFGDAQIKTAVDLFEKGIVGSRYKKMLADIEGKAAEQIKQRRPGGPR
jgi:hypothetical protein